METVPSSRIRSYATALPSSTSSSSISGRNRAATVPLAPKKSMSTKVSFHQKSRINALIGFQDGRHSFFFGYAALMSFHFDPIECFAFP